MRICYLSWPANEISGGIKLTYQHGESLQAAGIDAVVATADGAGPNWFQTNATTVSLEEIRRGDDILVFPENHKRHLEAYSDWPNPKVVFCQNHFMAWRGLGSRECYSAYGVTHILAEGARVVQFCTRRFPKLQIVNVPVFVDTERFRVGTTKQLQIAYAPRKRPLEAEFIRDLFRAENTEFRDVPWVPIAKLAEAQVADALSVSAVYLALCRFEAYPLSILEAMASGCICAGFTGHGGEIYATAANGYWTAEDDLLGAARKLACAVKLVAGGGAAYSDMVSQGVADARRHNRKTFEARLLGFWKPFLQALGAEHLPQ